MVEKAVHIVVHGRVQGVFFRASTEVVAQNLRLTGWVCNCDDGTVEIHAEGSEAGVKRFIGWCRIGPAAASVNGIDIDWVDIVGMKDFQIR